MLQRTELSVSVSVVAVFTCRPCARLLTRFSLLLLLFGLAGFAGRLGSPGKVGGRCALAVTRAD